MTLWSIFRFISKKINNKGLLVKRSPRLVYPLLTNRMEMSDKELKLEAVTQNGPECLVMRILERPKPRINQNQIKIWETKGNFFYINKWSFWLG